MITVKSKEEIEILREGGGKLAAILKDVLAAARPGAKTKTLDEIAERLIRAAGGKPAFKGYRTSGAKFPFPASVCVSVNDEVVHGIPSRRELMSGDIVGFDIGMNYRGLFTDMARSIAVGGLTDKKGEELLEVTEKALEIGISKVKAGARVGDIGEAVQQYVESFGFGVVRSLVGHGVGYKVHEDPEIPNWGVAGTGPMLKENMVIAIEPMVTEGAPDVFPAPDGWTWKTKNQKRAAHFEHSMVVLQDSAQILTKI